MSGRPFAKGTSVPIDRTQAEIIRLIVSHGAKGHVIGEQGSFALVGFMMRGRQLRFLLPIDTTPKAKSSQWKPQPLSQKNHAAELRRRWRALLLVLKAKLEAVESGIVEFDREFLAQIVTEGGVTVGDRIVHDIENVISQSRIPNLLGPGST